MQNLLKLGAAVTAYDVDTLRAEAAGRELGVAVAPALEPALASGVDALLVCTPTARHLQPARLAIEHGCHLFLEKPLSDSLDGVDELVEAAARKNLSMMVGCNFRFHRGLMAVKRMLDVGSVGRPLFVRAQFGQYLPDWHPWEDYRRGYSARRALGGGIVLDAVHEIDYVMWLLGDPIDVTAVVSRIGRLEIDTEDFAAIVLTFAGGAVAEIHMDYLQRAYSRSCEIVGEEGTATWSYQDDVVALYTAASARWEITRWPGRYDPDDMYLHEVEHFLACVRREARPVLDGAGGRRVLEVALAAKESAALGRRIELPQRES